MAHLEARRTQLGTLGQRLTKGPRWQRAVQDADFDLVAYQLREPLGDRQVLATRARSRADRSFELDVLHVGRADPNRHPCLRERVEHHLVVVFQIGHEPHARRAAAVVQTAACLDHAAQGSDNGRVTPLLFVFAHGAGAPSSHPWMKAWAALLGSLGEVETFDYPYMQGKKRAPDPQPALIRAHLAAIDQATARHPDHELILIGKSMGSRIGCHAALERPVSKLVCLGYPLVAAGDSGKVRDQVLLELETPILFVQGTRDPLCPLERLSQVRQKMQARSKLFVVDAGDHSLQVSKAQLKESREDQAAVDARILHVIRHFVRDTPGASGPPAASSG